MSATVTPLRRRFWVESLLAVATGALFVLTAVRPAWLEAVGLDPDHGDGSVEWLVVTLLFALACGLAVLARVEVRHTRALSTA